MQKITVKSLTRIFLAKWKWLLTGILIGGLLFSLYAVFVTGEKYTATVSMYVQNEESGGVATSNNLAASYILTNTYVVILEDADTLEKVAESMSEPTTVGQVRQAVSVTASPNTAMITVSATTGDPELSRSMCRAVCRIAPTVLRGVVSSGTVTAIGEVPAAVKTGPHIVQAAAYGVGLGLLRAMVAAYFSHISDTTIKGREELQEITEMPLLGEIPRLH